MTTIIVGGHSRKVGKTAVTAALIAAFAEYRWAAIKISTHCHGRLPHDKGCSIYEEHSREGLTDSSRFLAAGAGRSFWVQVQENQMEAAMPQLLPVLQSSPFLIIESNHILQYVPKDILIMVLKYDVADFKESARVILPKANAIVAINRNASSQGWEGLREMSVGIPVFDASDPHILPPGLMELVRSHLRRQL
jgi:hypothetical protein